MPTIGLYAISVLIWGTTWYGITLQIGDVPLELSVAYRFTLASLILFIYCRIRGVRLRFSVKDHLYIAFQGTLLFSIAYILQYYAAQYLTSGIMAVIFSTFVAMNIINESLFLHQRPQANVLLGAALGTIGISLVFFREFTAVENSRSVLLGLFLTLIGTYFASLGNILSARNQKKGLPVMQTNAYGMLYGAILTYAFSIVRGGEWTFDYSFQYIGSLLYLALFGSVIAFGSYLTLLGRIGPGRSSYVAILFPIVALLISTALEGYQWTVLALIGVTLILAGNLFVLRKTS